MLVMIVMYVIGTYIFLYLKYKNRVLDHSVSYRSKSELVTGVDLTYESFGKKLMVRLKEHGDMIILFIVTYLIVATSVDYTGGTGTGLLITFTVMVLVSLVMYSLHDDQVKLGNITGRDIDQEIASIKGNVPEKPSEDGQLQTTEAPQPHKLEQVGKKKVKTKVKKGEPMNEELKPKKRKVGRKVFGKRKGKEVDED